MRAGALLRADERHTWRIYGNIRYFFIIINKPGKR
jgi:hypothetical protein